MNHERYVEPLPIRGPRPRAALRAIVLGAGGQGLRRSQAIRLASGWELAGIHDADADRCRSAARRLGCTPWHDVDAALETAQADVVVIATPPYAHDGLIEAALAANRHVLCEKPLTIRPDSASRLAAEAERRGLTLATGFNHRFFRPVIDTLTLIRSNAFGAIRKIDAFIGHPPSTDVLDGWLGDQARSGGGVLIDNGSHLIDLMRLFLGELGPVSLEDLRWHPSRPGIDTSVRVRCRNASGAKAHAVCSWEEHGRPYLSIGIEFEGGAARLSAFPWTSQFVEFGRRGRTEAYWRDRIMAKFLGFRAPGLEPSLMRELEAIRLAILGLPDDRNPMPFATARDGARVAEIVASIAHQAIDSNDHGNNGASHSRIERRCA